MKNKLIKLTMIAAALMIHAKSTAEDITDTVTDIEEITADSEAAKAQAKSTRSQVERERIENAKALKVAYKTKQDAEAKRVQAAQTIQQSEAELERLALEHQRMQKDIDKLQFNILAAERVIQKSKDKIDKRKQENAALAAIRKEKTDKLAALNKEQMDVVRTASAAEDEHALLQRDLQKVTEEEIAAGKAIEKSKADAAYKRVELEKRIASLKERYRQIREQRKASDLEARKAQQMNYRLEQTVKAGQGEIDNNPEAPKAAAPAPESAPQPQTAEPQARN